MADINQITIDLSKTYTDSMQQEAINKVDTIAADIKSNGMPVYENCVIVTDGCGYPFLQTQDGNLINIKANYSESIDIHGEDNRQNCTAIISENEYTSSDTNIGYNGAWSLDILNNQYVVTSIEIQYAKASSVNIKPLSSDSIQNSADGIVYKLEFIPASNDFNSTTIQSGGSVYYYSEKITDLSGNVTYKVKFKLIPIFKYTLEGPKQPTEVGPQLDPNT